jgi:DNA-binding NtrC family response regulator
MQKTIGILCSAIRGLFTAQMSTEELEVQLGRRPAPDSRMTIVALLWRPSDRELLARLAAQQNWTLHLVDSCREARQTLDECKAQILLCDRSVSATHWSDVFQMALASGQSLYLILVSKGADDYLWNEVIRWGGHDLLPAPLKEERVLPAIQFAWSYWKRAMRVPTWM